MSAEAPPVDTFDMTVTTVELMAPPARGADVEQRLEFLHGQLDSIGTERAIMHGLVPLGSDHHERLQGGTAHVM